MPQPPRGSTDAILLLLAKLLAALTGAFVGFFVAYFISYLFITPFEKAIDEANKGLQSVTDKLADLDPIYNKAAIDYQLLGRSKGEDTSAPPMQQAPPEDAQDAVPPATAPPPAGTGSAVPGAKAAPRGPAPSPETQEVVQRYVKLSTRKNSLEGQQAHWKAEIADYRHDIFVLTLLSTAVILILTLGGYLTYPVFYRSLLRTSAQWEAMFTTRKLRAGPILVGFFAGMILAVLVLLALFTSVSSRYTSLDLPAFRLAFGTFVTLALGVSGALVGASYFSPPPPEQDPFEDYRRPAPPSLLDSSVLIDGRIYEVAANGFIGGCLIVTTSVLDELQALADSGDERKRGKGKRGLDLVNKMKNDTRLDLAVHDDSRFDRQARGADEHLILVAQAMGGQVVTNDYNLNRVATARDVRVINLNALANAVKTNHVPGDFIEIDISDRGKQRGQGVGYLADGTMVVIEDGEPFIGKAKTIKLTSISQTQAGRLLFGRVDAAEGDGGNGRHNGNGHHGGGR